MAIIDADPAELRFITHDDAMLYERIGRAMVESAVAALDSGVPPTAAEARRAKYLLEDLQSALYSTPLNDRINRLIAALDSGEELHAIFLGHVVSTEDERY